LDNFIKNIRDNLNNSEEQKLLDFVTSEDFMKNKTLDQMDILIESDSDKNFSEKFETIEKSIQ
jgi:hypothetical protein